MRESRQCRAFLGPSCPRARPYIADGSSELTALTAAKTAKLIRLACLQGFIGS